MRLLPDRHFVTNYKKRYNANYSKLVSRMDQHKGKKGNTSFDTIKQRIVGAGVFIFFVGLTAGIGTVSFNVFTGKANAVQVLENEIQELDEAVKRYQIIDSDEKTEQLNEVVQQVERLQGQYLSGDFDDTFDVYATQYLGDYNSNWADGIDGLAAPFWKGYLDRSCSFDDFAVILFILYDKDAPVMVVDTAYEIDRFGNIGKMTHMNKAVLS